MSRNDDAASRPLPIIEGVSEALSVAAVEARDAALAAPVPTGALNIDQSTPPAQPTVGTDTAAEDARDQQIIIDNAPKLAEAVQSDPENASKDFAKINAIIDGDDPKADDIDVIRDEAKDTALKFFATAVSTVLSDADLNQEEKKQAIAVIRNSFKFLESTEERDKDETAQKMFQAMMGIDKSSINDSAKGKIDANVKGLFSEFLRKNEDELEKTDDDEKIDVVGAGQVEAREAAAKKVVITAGRAAGSLALALALPGIGWALAIMLLVATRNLGQNKQKENDVELDKLLENSPEMQKNAARFGRVFGEESERTNVGEAVMEAANEEVAELQNRAGSAAAASQQPQQQQPGRAPAQGSNPEARRAVSEATAALVGSAARAGGENRATAVAKARSGAPAVPSH